MDWFFGDPHSNPELHPGSPAGGPGPGYFRRPGPLLDPPSCSAVPHPDSPAARHVEWRSELPRLVAAQRAKAVYEALAGARSYAPAAVRRATGQELEAVIDGIVPGLLMFVGVLAATTALGAAAGAAIGALFAGVGAVPGAVIGADVGLGAGAAILEYLGLAFLVGYIGASVLQAAKVAADAVESAWHSPEHREIESTVIAQASRQLADAVALVFRGVLQGVLAFLLAKGTAAAASRVPELVAKLRASKLGGGFAEWVEKNWVRLIEEPRLKDGPPPGQPPMSARDSGPAITPSQLLKMRTEGTASRQRVQVPVKELGSTGAVDGAGLGFRLNESGPTTLVARGPVSLAAQRRLNALDGDVGKFRPGEAGVAAEMENYLGSTLARAPAGTSADFVVESGPFAGVRLDLKLTPDTFETAAKLNKYFDQTFPKFSESFAGKLANPDGVDLMPFDTRFLTPSNAQKLFDFVSTLPLSSQQKVVFLVN